MKNLAVMALAASALTGCAGTIQKLTNEVPGSLVQTIGDVKVNTVACDKGRPVAVGADACNTYSVTKEGDEVTVTVMPKEIVVKDDALHCGTLKQVLLADAGGAKNWVSLAVVGTSDGYVSEATFNRVPRPDIARVVSMNQFLNFKEMSDSLTVQVGACHNAEAAQKSVDNTLKLVSKKIKQAHKLHR